MPARLRIIALCLVVGFALLGCTDQNLVGPTDAQLAKGGVPGAPGDSPDPVQLKEYYVFQDDTGATFVHILATGSFPRVNLNVVQDYIFNGIRDDNYSIFYEYTTSSPLPMGLEDLTEVGLWEFNDSLQAWHIDIPWNGETWYYDYTLPDYPRFDTFFPDFPHTDIDGSGGDPYAFDIRFQEENGDYIDSFQSQGIILGGIGDSVPRVDQPDGAAFHGEVDSIYSYATFSGTKGTAVFIDQIFVDTASITCDVRTIRERIDKVKITTQVTEVSLMAQVVLSSGDGQPIPAAWIDVMLAKAEVGLNGPEFLDSFSTTHDSEAWAGGWGVSTRFENPQTEFELRLAVPYVYATDLQHRMVYDPSGNQDGNGWDWTTHNAVPITAPGTFPYAITDPFTVACGR